MERLKKPSTIAALTWLKDRCVSMKVPQSRVMIEKAIEEMGYRIPKKPDTRYEQSRHQYVPICPTCNDDLDEEKSSENNFCPNCGQAIDWGNEHED